MRIYLIIMFVREADVSEPVPSESALTAAVMTGGRATEFLLPDTLAHINKLVQHLCMHAGHSHGVAGAKSRQSDLCQPSQYIVLYMNDAIGSYW